VRRRLVVSRRKKSGDEPLLCKDLIRAVVAEADAMAQRGEGRFHFKITTNGLLLDDAFLEFAVENDARVDRRSGRRDPLPGGGRPVSQVTLQPYEVAGKGKGRGRRGEGFHSELWDRGTVSCLSHFPRASPFPFPDSHFIPLSTYFSTSTTTPCIPWFR
jgi:hypothetical protein